MTRATLLCLAGFLISLFWGERVSALDAQAGYHPLFTRNETLIARWVRPVSGDAWEFVTPQQTSVVIPSGDLLRYGTESPVDVASAVVLVDGSRISGRIEALTSDHVRVSGTHFQTLVPMGLVRGVGLQMPTDFAAQQRMYDQMLTATGDQDALLCVNSDRLTGVLRFDDADQQPARLRRRTWTLETGDQHQQVEESKLRAIVFSPLLHRVNLPREGHWIAWDDGSRLAVRSMIASEDHATLTLNCGAKLKCEIVPLGITTITPVAPSMAWLSQHQPAAYRFKGTALASSLSWSLGIDTDLDGSPLIVDGVRYRHGISMHGPCQAAFTVPDGAIGFGMSVARLGQSPTAQTNTAIDASSNTQPFATASQVSLQVFTANAKGEIEQRLAWPEASNHEHSPWRLTAARWKLGDAKMLVFVVTDGGDGSAGDCLALIDARFEYPSP